MAQAIVRVYENSVRVILNNADLLLPFMVRAEQAANDAEQDAGEAADSASQALSFANQAQAYVSAIVAAGVGSIEAWAPATGYVMGEVVLYNQAAYMVAEDHSSAADFVDDLLAGRLILIFSTQTAEFRTKDFGFVGDGVTDNKAAYLLLVAAINASGNCKVIFEPGAVYYIDDHITAGNGNTVTDFEISDMTSLTIEGNGATLSIKGDFDRDVATTEAYSGFRIVDSAKIRINNLTVTGNVDQMTNTGLETEPSSNGFFFGSCDDVELVNVNSHLNSSDGFQFKENGLNPNSPDPACKRLKMTNCSARFNARQALSILQLRGAVIEGCDFSFTGFTDDAYTEGGYGTHSPAAGVDIEPNRDLNNGPSDVNTGDITFRNCHFEGNRGAQFISNGGSRLSDNIRIYGGDMIVGDGSFGAECAVLGGPDFIMEGVNFQAGESEKSILVFYNAPNKGTGTTWIRNNSFEGRFTFTSSGTDADDLVVIEDNDFRFTSASTFATGILINNTGFDRWMFRDNRVYVDGALYVDGGAGDRHICCTLTLGTYERNRWTTDLLAAAGSSGTAHYALDYGTAAVAVDEYFRGASAGTADTFRPIFNGTQDTNDLFQKLHHRAIVPGVGTSLGNSDSTLNAGRNRAVQNLTQALSADRAYTLAATAGIAHRGQYFIITRTAASTGAFNGNVKNHDGTTLKALTTGTWGRFDFDGTNWFLTGAGSL